jgi:hypothetical protein
MPLGSTKGRPASYEDILRLPENVVGEIVDGELIVSPRPGPRHALASSTAILDRTGKQNIYREQGVPWLWFVDPVARTIEVLRHTEQHWILAGSFGGNGERRIPPFDAVPIDVGALWDNPGEPQKI